MSSYYILSSLLLLLGFTGAAQKEIPADISCLRAAFSFSEEITTIDTSTIELITSQEYDKHFSQVKQTQRAIPETVIMDDSLIIIYTHKKEIKYRNSPTDWFGYGGYINELGLHSVLHADADAVSVSNMLIETNSGEEFYLPAQLDEALTLLPYQSSSHLLVFYGNSVLSSESEVLVYDVERKEDNYCLKKRSQNIFPWFKILEIYQSKNGDIMIFGENTEPQITHGIESNPELQHFKLILPK